MKYLLPILLLLALFSCQSQHSQKRPALPETILPVAVTVSFLPPSFPAEGQQHLFYELAIRSHVPFDVALARIDLVRQDAQAETLRSYTGSELEDVLVRPGFRGKENPLLFRPSQSAYASLALSLPATPSAPFFFYHRLIFERKYPDGRVREFQVHAAATRFPGATTVRLRPPFRAGNWLNFGSHHRGSLAITNGQPTHAQRFACDWVRVADNGSFAQGDATGNARYVTYGEEVLAVADGVVTAIRDNIPDNDPDSEEMAVRITRKTITGNFVLLDIGQGMGAFYAHLQPGRLLVKPGDKVRAGQVLGYLGNSGNSTGPHLHFHLTDDPSDPLAGQGIPYTFADLSLKKEISAEAMETIDQTGAWQPDEILPERAWGQASPFRDAVFRFK